MAGDAGEEAAIERQLEQQLDEQKESLAAVSEALASEPSNPELLAGPPLVGSEHTAFFPPSCSDVDLSNVESPPILLDGVLIDVGYLLSKLLG